MTDQYRALVEELLSLFNKRWEELTPQQQDDLYEAIRRLHDKLGKSPQEE